MNTQLPPLPSPELVTLAIEGAASRHDVDLRVIAAIKTSENIETKIVGNYGFKEPGTVICNMILDVDQQKRCRTCWDDWAKKMIAKEYDERDFECPFGFVSVAYLQQVRGSLYLLIIGGEWLEMGGEGRHYQSLHQISQGETRDIISYSSNNKPTLTATRKKEYKKKAKKVAEQVSQVVSNMYQTEFELARNELITMVREAGSIIYDLPKLSTAFFSMLSSAKDKLHKEQLTIFTGLDPYDHYVRFFSSSIQDIGPQQKFLLKDTPVSSLEAWENKHPKEVADFVLDRLESTDNKHNEICKKIIRNTEEAHVLHIENGTYAIMLVGSITKPKTDQDIWKYAVFGQDLEERFIELIIEFLRDLNRDQGLLRFTTRLTHLIRQPLSQVYGYTWDIRQALQTDEFEDDKQRFRHRLLEVERTINDATEQLDDLTRALRGGVIGGLSITIRDVDLKMMIDDVIVPIRLKATDRGNKISVIQEELSPGRMRFDLGNMKIALDNLLINALKYSHYNTLIIVKYGTRNMNGEKWAYISVQDIGQGFFEDEIDKIFLPFSQSRARDPRRAIMGTGMGLAFVRSILEAHGGTVTAECKGSGVKFATRERCTVIFTLTWPVKV